MTITVHPRPPVLARLTALALVGCVLALAVELIELGPDLSVSFVAACVLAAAAVAATVRRWGPLMGAVTIVVITANNPFLVENLAFVHGPLLFTSTAVNLTCAALAVVAGVGATVATLQSTRLDSR